MRYGGDLGTSLNEMTHVNYGGTKYVPDGGKLDDRWKSLDNRWNSPSPCAANVEFGICPCDG
jgi:hypothetical protein